MSDVRTKVGSGRVVELEGLRAVLAWTVVAVHILICCGYFGVVFLGRNLLSEIAEAAVDVFILLSGFAITRLVVVERESYGRYMWRRVCRIVPAYWIALVAAIFLNATFADNLRHFLPSPDARSYIGICEAAGQSALAHTALHIPLLHGLVPAAALPAAPYAFLGVAWSLSLEWQFYLIAPLVIGLAVRSGRFAIALGAVCAVCALFVAPIVGTFSNAFLPAKAAYFFVGGATFLLTQRERGLRTVAILTGATAMLYAVGSGRIIEATLPACAWVLVIASSHTSVLRPVKQFLASRPLQYFGRISYSTYLFHAPVIAALQFVIWRFATPANRLSLLLLTAPAALAATWVISDLSWRLIERRFQRLGRLGLTRAR